MKAPGTLRSLALTFAISAILTACGGSEGAVDDPAGGQSGSGATAVIGQHDDASRVVVASLADAGFTDAEAECVMAALLLGLSEDELSMVVEADDVTEQFDHERIRAAFGSCVADDRLAALEAASPGSADGVAWSTASPVRVVVESLIAAGFSESESTCVMSGLIDEYTLDAVEANLLEDAPLDSFNESFGRIVDSCVETAAPVETTNSAAALVNTAYVCTDAQGDVVGELSGKGPSVPVNAGDFAEASVDFSRDGLNIWTRTFDGSFWMGGPGDATLDIFLVVEAPHGSWYEARLAHWGGDGEQAIVDAVIPDLAVNVTAYATSGEQVGTLDNVSVSRYGTGVTANDTKFVNSIEATIPYAALDGLAPGWTFQVVSVWGPDSDMTGDHAGQSQYRIDFACDPAQEFAAAG